jgi:mannose-6-phosphate isomerase-like protein (cupin superfamily)
MKQKHLRFGEGFRVAITTKHAQIAEMVIPPGDAEGGPDNRHGGADQWLYVVSGSGYARVNRRRVELRPGTLLLIERDDRHEIKNTGRTPLRTLNVYVPPAYSPTGKETARAKPSRRLINLDNIVV